MEHDKSIHNGNLLIPAAGKILLKKSWQQKYCLLFKGSKFGVQRLEIYDNADGTKQTPHKIITLQDCIKVIPKNSTYFTITTSSAVYEFEALSTISRNEWLTAVQSVAFPDDCSKVTSMEEDNDLYCPSGGGIFNVKLHSSPASIRCGLEPKVYLLVLTNNGVQLRNCNDNQLLYNWPYCFIRRYGYKNGKFTFEAGRKCESGEGIFYLEHSNLQEIFRCFAAKIKTMKKLLSSETFPSIVDLEASVHTALGMEARSRSPLPVSLSSLSSMYNIEHNISSNSLISLSESEDLTESRTMVKPQPTKPPRRNIPVKEEVSKPLYEFVNKYDEIEYRNDAWRTMGVNDIAHVENEAKDMKERNVSPAQAKKLQSVTMMVTQAPKVIEDPQNEEDYDKLNFFRSNSKSNNITSTYKQVRVMGNESTNVKSYNDYDEIEVELPGKGIIFNNRNDHKNCVVLQHTSVQGKDNQIAHHFHNDEPYAVISKPKQV